MPNVFGLASTSSSPQMGQIGEGVLLKRGVVNDPQTDEDRKLVALIPQTAPRYRTQDAGSKQKSDTEPDSDDMTASSATDADDYKVKQAREAYARAASSSGWNRTPPADSERQATRGA